MAHGSARIESPEILRQFRGAFSVFESSCRNALMGVDASIKRTGEWLKGEQQVRLKQDLRRHENAVNLAQNEYNRVKMSAAGAASNAVIDAKKLLDRAKRHKEEAHERLERAKKWSVTFAAEVEKLLAVVRSFEILLDDTTPRALSRLDRMVESLEEYLRTAPPEGV
ncbi:MAG: hypothetical protein HYY18_08080 [Planctomycetes bacterium]|nr:hypothetical protein [Planctomycetota bacterium]